MSKGNSAPPCPQCGSDNVWEIIGSCDWDKTEKGFKKLDKYSEGLRPSEGFECQDCKYRWENPEYEKYLLNRVIK